LQWVNKQNQHTNKKINKKPRNKTTIKQTNKQGQTNNKKGPFFTGISYFHLFLYQAAETCKWKEKKKQTKKTTKRKCRICLISAKQLHVVMELGQYRAGTFA